MSSTEVAAKPLGTEQLAARRPRGRPWSELPAPRAATGLRCCRSSPLSSSLRGPCAHSPSRDIVTLSSRATICYGGPQMLAGHRGSQRRPRRAAGYRRPAHRRAVAGAVRLRWLAGAGRGHAHGQPVLDARGSGQAARSRRAADRAGAGGSGAGQRAVCPRPAALADYAEVSKPALDKLAELAALDLELPLGDLGTYPAAVLPLRLQLRSLHPHPGRPVRAARPADRRRCRPRTSSGSGPRWTGSRRPCRSRIRRPLTPAHYEIQITGTGARSIRFGIGSGDGDDPLGGAGPDPVDHPARHLGGARRRRRPATRRRLAVARKLKVF